MNRLIASTCVLWALGVPSARAEGPMDEAASRAWAITDAVLDRHVAPPARQQMLLAGLKAMAVAERIAVPGDLARRVSDLANPDQLAALLAEVQAAPRLPTEAAPKSPRRTSDPDGLSPDGAFFEGLLSAVPGGAELMPEKERKVQESFQANLYVGIQVALAVDDESKRPVFREIFQGGPADGAGAKVGDLIEEIDGQATTEMPLRQVVERLRGAEGTDVLVRFRRPGTGEVFTKPMTRGRLPRATVKREAVRLNGPAPIGYLKITEVSGSTPQELRGFAAQLESEGAKALVLDLREVDSAGFHETVLLADALLDGGIIGQVASPDGIKTYRAEPDALFRGWPMAVIVEGNHQPAVAWLGEALVDNRRATVLGEPALLRDPTILEMVALPGGEWSVQMATGRLRRGDGQPLPHSSPEDFEKNRRQRKDDPKTGEETTRPTPSGPDLLLKARQVLVEALGGVN